MAIAKKDRFGKRVVQIVVSEDSNIFPPKQIIYEDNKLFCLGTSNKADLIQTSDEYDRSEKKGQFIYSSEAGDMYDCCMYTDYTERVILIAIRTRLK